MKDILHWYNIQISLNVLNVVSFYNLCNIFADECLNMKLLIYMPCIVQNLKKNAQVSINSLANLNIRHCVELTFFLGQAGWIFCGKGLKI